MAGTILAVGLVVFFAHFFAALFERTRVPDVLSLILLGMLLGPATGLATPASFGAMGGVMSTVALVVILFESGMSLETSAMLKAWKPTLGLALGTFVVTVVIISLVGVYLMGFSWTVALMLGSICSGISAATVLPLVKILKLRDPASTIIVIETALAEMLCIVMAFALLEAAQLGKLETGKIVGSVFASIICAGLIGIAGGLGWLLVLNAVRQFPNTAFTTCAYACVLYGVTELLHFSGAIAALAFGFALTNIQGTAITELPMFHKRELGILTEGDKKFFLEIIFLLKTFFFVYLGVSIQFTDVRLMALAGLVVLAVYLARTILVRVAVGGASPGWEESAMLTALVPKGLAAAVLASYPLRMGLADGEVIQSFTYMVVLLSTLLTAALIPAAKHRVGARASRWLFLKRPMDAAEETVV